MLRHQCHCWLLQDAEQAEMVIPAGGGSEKGSVYFLNFKSELSAEWEEVAGTFTEETGIDMKVVTAGSGTYEQTLNPSFPKKKCRHYQY